MKDNKPLFDQDFASALQALMDGHYIQGERYTSGMYVAVDDMGMAANFDVTDNNRRIGNFFVTRGLYNQRYRVFTVAHQAIH